VTEAATRFLRALDLNAERFTFQTFDDSKRGTVAPKRFPASPDNPVLGAIHDEGGGIYVTVNETDLKGRETENIIRVRAVWNENDGAFTGQYPLQPTLKVETSPGHFHDYWLIADEWKADAPGAADHAGVLDRMVTDYGCDNGAKGINRVLRVPGFLNRKYETPFTVQIVGGSGKRYTRDQILKAFPPFAKNTRQTGPAHPMPPPPPSISSAFAKPLAMSSLTIATCGSGWGWHLAPSSATPAACCGTSGRQNPASIIRKTRTRSGTLSRKMASGSDRYFLKPSAQGGIATRLHNSSSTSKRKSHPRLTRRAPISGASPHAFTSGHDHQEFDKRLTAALIEARPAVFLDNYNAKELRSDTLASAITEDPSMVRVMGQSKTVPLHNRTLILVTGNGVQISEDIARRILKISLDAKMEDPEQRSLHRGFSIVCLNIVRGCFATRW
jgi:hypothetical protein